MQEKIASQLTFFELECSRSCVKDQILRGEELVLRPCDGAGIIFVHEHVITKGPTSVQHP